MLHADWMRVEPRPPLGWNQFWKANVHVGRMLDIGIVSAGYEGNCFGLAGGVNVPTKAAAWSSGYDRHLMVSILLVGMENGWVRLRASGGRRYIASDGRNSRTIPFWLS